jgi:cytidyltransferase-like protein
MASMESTVARWIESSPLVAEILTLVHRILLHAGFTTDDEQHLPSARNLVYATSCVLAVLFWFMYRKQSEEERRQRRFRARQQQMQEKSQNQQPLSYLQKELRPPSSPSSSSTTSSPFSSLRQKGEKNDKQQQDEKEEVRIFMDGAFDLLHYGHMNAFRLGRSLGTHLIVGLNSDESITTCKGSAPLMNDNERLTMVAACKFVDEVVPDCPYIMNKKYLDFVIEKYRIDFVIHGDDPCIVDGKDVYATAKAAGKYRQIPRTEGVSTTDIVGRMLVMTKEHHYQEVVVDTDDHDGTNNDEDDGSASSDVTKASNSSSAESVSHEQSPAVGGQRQQSKFVNTSRMLQLFSSGLKAPTVGMTIVYIDGAWDLFHPRHVAILKAAREVGYHYCFAAVSLVLAVCDKAVLFVYSYVWSSVSHYLPSHLLCCRECVHRWVII